MWNVPCHQTVEEDKKALEEYLKDNEEDALKLVYHEALLNIGKTKLGYKKDQNEDQKRDMARQNMASTFFKKQAK